MYIKLYWWNNISIITSSYKFKLLIQIICNLLFVPLPSCRLCIANYGTIFSLHTLIIVPLRLFPKFLHTLQKPLMETNLPHANHTILPRSWFLIFQLIFYFFSKALTTSEPRSVGHEIPDQRFKETVHGTTWSIELVEMLPNNQTITISTQMCFQGNTSSTSNRCLVVTLLARPLLAKNVGAV